MRYTCRSKNKARTLGSTNRPFLGNFSWVAFASISYSHVSNPKQYDTFDDDDDDDDDDTWSYTPQRQRVYSDKYRRFSPRDTSQQPLSLTPVELHPR